MEWDPSNVPVPGEISLKFPNPLDTSRDMRGPDDVDAHPQGASPFGVQDMIGKYFDFNKNLR